MVAIPLGTTDWESVSEDVPRVKLHNMYIIEDAASADGMSRVSRPTLTRLTGIGAGPIMAIWRQDGCLDGNWLVVSGTELYVVGRASHVATKIADIPGVDYCDFAGSANRVVILRDGVAYSTDGLSLTVINFPDDIPGAPPVPLIQSVAVINSIFILTVQDTQRFYWINPGETDPDPLHYASAERLPDNIEAVAINNDEVWFIGTQGPEVWSPSTDIDLPFQRINGRVYSDGCSSRHTVVSSSANNRPCLIWCTPEGAVVMGQGSVAKISNESVEEALRSATNLRAWPMRTRRHDFYILSSDQFTYVYDLTQKTWSRWDTYQSDFWDAHLGLQDGSDVFAGSATTNRIYQLVEGYDDDGIDVVREVSGLVANTGKPLQCVSVAVRVNAGWSPSYDYQPVLELRWSDTQGADWSDYVQIGLGVKGQYQTDTVFRSLGLIVRPGRIFEVRFTGRARFRIDYAVMNEV